MPVSRYLLLARNGGLWIVLLVLLAYWPLSTFQHSLSAGDTLDCWLPWRFFLSATMQDGALPAWNPYQQMGYPVHADLQGPAWYPEAILIAGTVGHSVYILSLLFLAYLIIGGLGMRRLVLQMGLPALPAFLAGAAYALSGFFTGHAMHFYAVISAAWLPWLFWSALRVLDLPSVRNALVLALFSFFLLTGGNHTFLIIASYPLLALGGHALYRAWRAGDRALVCRILGAAVLAAAVAFVLAIGTFHALWEVGPFIERARAMALDQAAVDPFTLPAAISLLLPWMATLDAAYLGTDPSMANGSFGALMLAFALVGMTRPLGVRLRILSATAVIAALASFGGALPVHALLWRWVPGMDLFRFPAYFHFFVVFALLPLAAQGFTLVVLQGVSRKRVLVVLALLGMIVSALLFFAEWGGWPAGDLPLMERVNATHEGTRAIVNGSVVLALFAAAFFALWRRSGPRTMAALMVLELLVAVQFTQWGTALGPVSPAAIQWRIDAQPTSPTVPLLRPMVESRDGSQVMHHLWRNTQVFRGDPTHDGFNSFWLKDHQALQLEHPGLHQAMLREPMVYLARRIISDPVQVDPLQDSAVVVADAAWSDAFRPATVNDRPALTAFDHNKMTIQVAVKETAFLVVQQNHYPGWRMYVDGEQVPVHTVNVAAFGAFVPAGEHSVQVRYEKPLLAGLRVISLGAFLLVLFMLAWTAPEQRTLWACLVALLGLAFAWSFFAHRSKAERIADQWPLVVEGIREFPRVPVVVNTDRAPSLGPGPWSTYRIDRPDVSEALDAFQQVVGADSVWLAWAGLPVTASMRAWAMDHYGPLQRCVGGGDAGAWLLVKGREERQEAVLYPQDHRGEEMTLIDPTSPYSPAFRVPVKELLSRVGDHLVIDLRFKAVAGVEGRLVLERKRGEHTTDYEAVPFGEIDTQGEWRSLYVVRPKHTLGSAVEELGVYVWNASGEPLTISDLRVRTMDLGDP